MSKKLTSIVLVLCMIVSCVAVGSFATAAVSTKENSVSASVDSGSVAANYGLASKVEDGNILHCFNWKLSDITAALPKIAEAGFTSVQTSPVQPHDASGTWYWLYQPLEFKVGNDYCTEDELKTLCSTADNYGIKVIVDVVANHLAGWANGTWKDYIQSDLKDAQYFHNTEYNTDANNIDWGNRWQVTHCNIGMPDLNSEHSYVQQVVAGFVNQLKNDGVDGIRWDAAKHIGLPSEDCNFWPAVTKAGLYNYGEILDGPINSGGDDKMKEYTNYIGVTDDNYCGEITGSMRDGSLNIPSNSGKWLNRGVPANKLVLWAESHDTYCNNGWTNGLSENVIDRSYAVSAARAGSQALYLSRPFEKNHDSIQYAKKGSEHFTAKEVAAVNHFHNAMVGTGEYFTTAENCVVVCRGGGAVISSAGGGNRDVSVPNGGGMVPAGTYTDEVSGSTWTVTSSTISGHIGSSGIAVVYNAPAAGPSVSAAPGSSNYKTDTLTVTLSYSNATSGTYSVDGGSAQSFTGTTTVTIGSGKPYGTTTTITVTATDGSKSDSQTYTYTKVDPYCVQTVSFDNSSYNWSQVYCYMYAEGGTPNNGMWPGQLMTKGSNNIYTYEVPDGLENALCIFTETKDATDHRYPADQDPGLPLGGNSMILKANHSWEVDGTTPVTQPTTQPVGKVLIGDVDLNSRVTIKDATFVQMHLASMQTLTGDALTAADTNKDNSVNVRDITAIQRYLAGFNDSGNYCGQYTDGTQPVTQPTTPTTPTTPAGNYIYFQNNKGWSTVYAHMWNGSNTSQSTVWHGTLMTNVGSNVWRVEVPDGYNMVVFNDGGTNQTDDISMQLGKVYNDQTQQWTSYAGGDEPVTTPTTPVSGGVTLNPGKCNTGDEVWYAWTWGSGEGQWIKGSASGSNYTFSGVDSNIIFVRMNGDNPNWDNVWNKTDDLTTQMGGTYTISDWGGNGMMVGSW